MTTSSPTETPQSSGAERSQEDSQESRGSNRWVRFLEAYALLVLLVLMAVFFTLLPETSDTFPTTANLKILLASQAVIGIVALGALIPLVAWQFDLSVGAIAALSAVLVADVASGSTPLLVAIAMGIGVGLVVGVVNAIFVTRFSVPSFVATLGMSTLLTGVILHATGGLAQVHNIPEPLTDFGVGTVLGIPAMFVALMVLAAIAFFVLEHTAFGRHLYALGSNPTAALLVGIRARSLQSLTFVIGGMLCGAAGVLYVARAGGADPKLATAFTLPALAAAFLSAAAVRPGRYNVWGTIVAIYFLAVLNNGLNLAGVAPYVSDYINGGALILGVAIATALQRRRLST